MAAQVWHDINTLCSSFSAQHNTGIDVTYCKDVGQLICACTNASTMCPLRDLNGILKKTALALLHVLTIFTKYCFMFYRLIMYFYQAAIVCHSFYYCVKINQEFKLVWERQSITLRIKFNFCGKVSCQGENFCLLQLIQGYFHKKEREVNTDTTKGKFDFGSFLHDKSCCSSTSTWERIIYTCLSFYLLRNPIVYFKKNRHNILCDGFLFIHAVGVSWVDLHIVLKLVEISVFQAFLTLVYLGRWSAVTKYMLFILQGIETKYIVGVWHC